MMEELGIWLDDIGNQLEIQSHDEAQLRVLQGNAEAVRGCQNLVDQMIENLEGDIDQSDMDEVEKELEEEDE